MHQSEKLNALGSLLAGIAHELNNPLSVVVGRAIMLEEQLRNAPQVKGIAKIRAAAERCARIVKTFLAMARQQKPARTAVQLKGVIDAALELVRYGLRADGVAVSVDLDEDLPQLTADPNQLIQVFTNLFINAQQALAESSAPKRLIIKGRTDHEAQVIKIWVTDNGPGIPKKIVSRIFEPFFSSKAVGKGTGVGLSVSHGILRAHGGTIHVAFPDQPGTTFELTLPIESSAVTTDTESIATVAQSASDLGLIYCGKAIMVIFPDPFR